MRRRDIFSEIVEQESGLVKLVHEIYEDGTPYPVVTHIFKGKDREEAQGYMDSHMKTDKFMAAMEKTGKFEDIKVRTKKKWE